MPETEPTPRTLPDDVRRSAFIVIAAYNEATSIGNVVAKLRETYPQVIVVDDGSDDDTRDAARGARFVLRHDVNRGQGAALQTGITFALARGAAYIVTFDADGQHRPEDIAALLAPLRAGACDVTLGSRFLGETVGAGSDRRLMLRLAVLFTRCVSGVKLTDAHNGLRAFTRHAAARIEITADRMAHASELIDLIRRAKLRFREVPVRIEYTAYSRSKGQRLSAGFRIVGQYLLTRILR